MKTDRLLDELHLPGLTCRDFFKQFRKAMFQPIVIFALIAANVFAILIGFLSPKPIGGVGLYCSASLSTTLFFIVPWAWHITHKVNLSQTLRLLTPTAFGLLLGFFMAINLALAVFISISPVPASHSDFSEPCPYSDSTGSFTCPT